MADLGPYLYGDRPPLVAAVAFAVTSAVATAILVIAGRLDAGTVEWVVFAAVFGALPALVGAICGRYRLGFPAAVAGGVAPAVAFYAVIVTGLSLDFGGLGGGVPLPWFAFALGSASFVWATAGFAVAVVPVLLGE